MPESPPLTPSLSLRERESKDGRSNHLPASRPHEEVEDHSEDGQEHDDDDPQDLGSAVGVALQKRNQGNDVEHQNEQPKEREGEHGASFLSFLWSSNLLSDRFGLCEEVEVLAPAGLGVGAGHVESAERMHAH